MPADKLCSKDFRDVKKALIVLHVVNIFSAVFDRLFYSEFPRLIVSVLQFLEFFPNNFCDLRNALMVWDPFDITLTF